jgi:hypothetical protein
MLGNFWRYLGASSLIVGSMAIGSPARAATYMFDNYIGVTNDFSISAGGEKATFSSSTGPATFTVNQSSDIFTFPVALGGFGNFSGDPLTITFSDPVLNEVIIPFGVFEAYATAPVTLVATANTGQTTTFTSAFDNMLSGSPEGLIDFVPTGAFSSLTLTSELAFAIASVDMEPVVAPGGSTVTTVSEPRSAALLFGGLIIVALTRRRTGIAGRRTI